jgi:hypothetical protein
MKKYINGAIKEGIEKARVLMAKIPRAKDLGLYFSPLATVANAEIQDIIDALDYLYSDVDFGDSRSLRQKFFRFKQLSGKLSEIENVVIAAMNRKNIDDEFVNKLVFEICKEINYPLQHPVASCLSQKYYHIYPHYNLICIPLLESDFVLHIPDIYHELGHPLITMDNPKTEPFRVALGRFNAMVRKHFDEEVKRRDLSKMVDPELDPLLVYKDAWLENWSTEIFCDLFATYTLGPAYAWSNIHMCAKMSWDVYRLPVFQKTTHPPDDARMTAINIGLKLINCNAAVTGIENKWDEFKQIIGQKRPSEFSIAIPVTLLNAAAELCLIGVKELQCEIYNPVADNRVTKLLNSSWDEFWKDPDGFTLWEKKAVINFKALLNPNT